jgi:Protein of unknown function (DUF3606)
MPNWLGGLGTLDRAGAAMLLSPTAPRPGCALHLEKTMDDLKKKGTADRSKINMREEHEVKYWTKQLGVSKEELQKAVNKVGNSAAAVRKQLGQKGTSLSGTAGGNRR